MKPSTIEAFERYRRWTGREPYQPDREPYHRNWETEFIIDQSAFLLALLDEIKLLQEKAGANLSDVDFIDVSFRGIKTRIDCGSDVEFSGGMVLNKHAHRRLT